jgi:hypothetical protein
VGYLLSGLGAWDQQVPHERHAANALDALRAATAYLREDHPAQVHDDVGRPVSLARLRAAAAREAGDQETRRELTTVLADYAEAERDRDLERARAMYALLTGPRYEEEMSIADSLGSSTDEQRRRDADERHRLRDYLFDDGSWRDAGAAWARDFGAPPSREVVAELARRHPDSHCEEFRLGADEWLTRSDALPDRYHARQTPDGFWGIWNVEQRRFVRTYAFENIARSHTDALNGGRHWTEQDFGRQMQVAVELMLRRSERARWAGGSTASAPADPAHGPSGRTRTRRPG